VRTGVICPCGKTFEAAAWQIRSGRGKYCSKVCFYDHRVRPSGLTYTIAKPNPTSFRQGQEPWNKGVHSALSDAVSYDVSTIGCALARRPESREHCGVEASDGRISREFAATLTIGSASAGSVTGSTTENFAVRLRRWAQCAAA
jgi:hypothetical protein